uniref:Glutamine--fructose-6-phosphate aminotransferase [isomerizing] n=1 Tax=uncultured Fidelibacterota bacterium HF0500_01L02 TaxID=710790 RepID=E0XY04_9BACT|nr:glucosamine 6-phosphate synthetase, contains amidotransferase and phosphosugar isomerase domains [uncultured Marinimicrobia bacterium HF0500_01L02]
MCGIIGYYGKKDSVPILLNGLKRLEYRGYDSAGIAVMGNDGIQILKKAGKVSELDKIVDDSLLKGTIGMGHTRWATHGEPNDTNAHPHLDQTGKISVIHNGIIENYSVIKEALINKGYKFKSETDTEIIPQLISNIYFSDGLSFEQAVQVALTQVVGTFGLVAFCSDEPDKLVAARHGSPLVLGIGKDDYFIASDASPIVDYTRNVVYLDEGEILTIDNGAHEIRTIAEDKVVQKISTEIDFTIDQIEKGDFPHYMLKEIHEQVNTITDTMRGRLNIKDGTAHLGGISDHIDRIQSARRFYITACGTSWHAGLIGKYLIEEYAGIPVHVEYASEFRYSSPIVDSRTVVIAISQSGETADTLAAIRKAKESGALTLGICNVVGSSISRETDCGIYTHAGPEIGVASTKAFTAQVTVLFLLSLCFGRKNGVSSAIGQKFAKALLSIGKKVQMILDESDKILEVAKSTMEVDNYLYLGRGMNYPVALEGALKLKEISYIHAEGYPAAEMKHGPIALIDDKMPVIFLAPHDNTYEKILSNIQEVKSRKGVIITVTDKRTKDLEKISDYIIEVPSTHPKIFPLLASIPLQLLAYHLAVLRGSDVDQPRNLAKSVTVE